jgi:hypothetical protein
MTVFCISMSIVYAEFFLALYAAVALGTFFQFIRIADTHDMHLIQNNISWGMSRPILHT